MTRGKEPNNWEIALGALLHDIGKLVQRASSGKKIPQHILDRQTDILPSFQGRKTHWHALWSDVFFDWVEQENLPWPKEIDVNTVRNLAVYHHAPLQAYKRDPNLVCSWLTTIADRVASGYERKAKDIEQEASEKGRNGFRKTPMFALQTRLDLTGGEKKDGIYETSPLSPKSIMPAISEGYDRDEIQEGYRQLLDGFKKGWVAMSEANHKDKRSFEAGVLSLMERFTWCVPSSTIDQPDVSLFDHSRAVSAFAVAMGTYHKSRNSLTSEKAIRDLKAQKFRFLVGDLSGLQRTLFRLNNEGVRGLNRILRGRSLRFQFIAEMAVRRVLDEFDLPLASALQTAGGRFLILLPELANSKTDQQIDGLKVEFDEWLVGQYCGDLGVGLALSAPFAAGDLSPLPSEKNDRKPAMERAKRVRDKLRNAIELAKLKQLQAPAAQAVVDYNYTSGSCQSCGVRPVYKSDNCKACYYEHEHGRSFPKSVCVSLLPPGSVNKGDTRDEVFGGCVFLREREQETTNIIDLGWRFSDDLASPAIMRMNKPYVPFFKEGDEGKYQDEDDKPEPGHIKTFSALAQDSQETIKGKHTGRKMLAVLKADVDNLGQIFSTGLGQDWSIARLSALSRMIDGYFTMRLPFMLKEKYPNIYTVYAGGDDLMLVGPWQDIIDFARYLRNDFCKFSLNNSDLTLSIGISLFDSKTPISIPAREAEDRLERAKEYGRNKICVLDEEPMTFEAYEKALVHAENICTWLRKESGLSTGGLYKFLYFDECRKRIKNKSARNDDYAWMARMGYHMARLLPKHCDNQQDSEIFQTFLELFDISQKQSGWSDGSYKPGVRLAISHALYRNR